MNERVLHLLEFPKIRSRIMDFCATPYGAEHASGIHPLPTLEDARAALDDTAEAATIFRLKGLPPFPLVGDVRPAVLRANIGSILSPADLAQVAITANRARRISRLILDLSERAELPLFLGLTSQLQVAKEVEGEIFSCLDEDAVVLDQASPDLYRIRRDIRTTQDRMKRTLDEMVRSPQLQRHLQDTIITMRQDRYCLAVKAESQGQIRGVVHDESASGSTVFIEPERVLHLGNELRKHRTEEEREIERILVRLSAVVAEHAECLKDAVKVMGRLDFALAKAQYAKEDRCVMPSLSKKPFLRIKGGRHPLIDREKVVPLDVRLGDGFYLLVITGPNTGGKTVTLKTMGLLTVMALSGLYIPAEEGTEIGFFREVYADIGDEQSIEQNLSTFSSHMKNIVGILKQADSDSMVLFDELGAGTDPTEGAALAMAILDDLRERRICTVATTHYSELKAYAYTTEQTMNASVEFDVETLAPTYRLLMGIPGRSNAFAIASRIGLPAFIIETAQDKLSTHDVRVEDLIVRLEESVVTARREEEASRKARQHAERLEQELEALRAREEEEQARRKERAEEEVRAYIKRKEREAEELLVELREYKDVGLKMKDHEVAEARKRFERLAPGHTLQTRATSKERREAAEGDEVRVLSLAGQKGTVMEALPGGSELVVAVGVMKVKVERKDVEVLRRKEKIPTPTTLVTRTSDVVSPQIDLRGTTVEEAIVEIDRYLDRALMSGYHQVTLIHGKGTGALRRGLQEYLRAHPRIRGSRSGGEGEGGSGVTVVELK